MPVYVINFESYIVIEIRFNSFCAYLQQPNLKLDVDVDECSFSLKNVHKIIYIHQLVSNVNRSDQRTTVQTKHEYIRIAKKNVTVEVGPRVTCTKILTLPKVYSRREKLSMY